MAHEVRWSCGCYEEDGKLVTKCTQTPPQGEISAAQHAVNQPFSRKCARLAQAATAKVEAAAKDTVKTVEKAAEAVAETAADVVVGAALGNQD